MVRCDGVGRVQVHAALRFEAQRPQAFHVLAVKVEFGRVGDAQHHGMLLHARSRAFPMRLHHVGPLDFLVAKKLIGRHGLCQAIACTRNARDRLCRQALQQILGTPVSPWGSKVQRLKCLVHSYP